MGKSHQGEGSTAPIGQYQYDPGSNKNTKQKQILHKYFTKGVRSEKEMSQQQVHDLNVEQYVTSKKKFCIHGT